jgi:DNA-binding MarR family transcriptional regulator
VRGARSRHAQTVADCTHNEKRAALPYWSVTRRGLDELEDRSWQALLCAHWRVTSRLDAELQATQRMSFAEYEVLLQLSDAQGGMRMSDLAERLQLSPSGLTRRLDRLVATGLVERLRCPTDGRGSYARLTTAGRRRLVRAAPDHTEQVRRNFVDRLSRRELEMLAQALEKIASDLDQADRRESPSRRL